MKLRPIAGKAKKVFLSLIYPFIPNAFFSLFFNIKKINWTFIVGSTNCGSTLLQDMLASHELLSTMEGEGQYRTKYLKLDKDRLFGEKINEFKLTEKDNANYERVRFDWFFAAKGTRKNIIEKTPVNAMRMRWLQSKFKPAKFIVLARSPYAVCEGMNRKIGVSIERAAFNWNEIYSEIIDTSKHLDNVLFITYDQLTVNPGKTLIEIKTFLELNISFPNISESELQIHEQKSTIKNMDYKSINNLSSCDFDIINGLCSKTMKKLDLDIIYK